MTWAEAYGKNFPKRYNALLDRGIQKAKNNGNEGKIQELADFLNDVFYPKDDNSNNKN